MSNKKETKDLEFIVIDGVGETRAGTQVEHQTFGLGVVEYIFQYVGTDDILIRINFSNHGSKALVPEYAKLSKPKVTKKKKSILSRLFG